MTIIYQSPIDATKASKYLFDLETNYNQSLFSSIEALSTALESDDPEVIYLAAILVCGNTREASFGSDFAASADFTKLGLEETQRVLSATLALFVRSAEMLKAAALKMQVLYPERAEQVEKYCDSTNDRKRRLTFLCNNQLLEAFESMSNDLGLNLNLASLEPSCEKNSGYTVATCLQWLAHRLLWIARELSLESGPHFEALEKQLAFFRQQDETVCVIERECGLNKSESSESEKPFDRMRFFISKGSELHKSLLAELQSFTESYQSANSFQKQNAAKEQTSRLRNQIISYMTQLNALTSATLEFTPLDDAQPCLTSRVLLTNDDNGPQEWTAADLDYGAVTFGNTQEEALDRLASIVKLHQKLPGGRSKRVNKVTLTMFEAGIASSFSNFPQFAVRTKLR